jgi:hypothetical protein
MIQSNEIDLLFPSRAIEPLRKLRGEQWENLVTRVVALESGNPGRAAFVLFMVKISGCTNCQSDSYRAMRGCILCSTNTIKRYKGSDQNLIDLYNEAMKDISKYMKEV